VHVREIYNERVMREDLIRSLGPLWGRGRVFCWLTCCCVVFAGCAGMPVGITPSTSPVAPGTRGTIPAYGSDCQFYLLGLIPITHSLNTQAALDRAKAMANVDVLTDVTVDFVGGYYILFSNNCVRVQGKGVPREVINKQ
jgi:hypothetical protein